MIIILEIISFCEERTKDMKEVREIRERYFRHSKRMFAHGVHLVKFETWPDQPIFGVWSNWTACAKEKCIISYRCEHVEDVLYCTVVRNRISKILNTIEDSFRNNPLSSEKLSRIGSELMPLYSQLVRAQMYDEELSAMVMNLESNAPKFTWAYKEVQSLVDRVARTWREIGIYENAPVGRPQKTNRSRNLPHQASEPPEPEEEMSYYEKLELRHGVKDGSDE